MRKKRGSEGIRYRDGRYQVTIYAGKEPARRCLECRRRVWAAEHVGNACPKCDGALGAAVDEWRQRTYGPYRTKKEARDARLDLLSRKQRGDYVSPSTITTGEYLTRWVKGADVKPTTREAYRANVINHLIPALGSTPLQKLTTAKVNALYRGLEAGGRRDGKPLSKKSVRNVHALLRRALRDALDEGLVIRNVAANAAAPKQVRRRDMRTWNADQLRAFLAHVGDDPLRALWVLYATTGMRRGEALGLRWRNLNLDAGTLSVVESIVPVGYAAEISTPKTDTGVRSIDLDSETVAALRAHYARQGEDRLALGLGKPTEDDYVFTTPDGASLHPHAISQAFEAHIKRAGLPRIRLHDLRHTWASLALAAGVPAKVVSERLGHASVAFTMSVYQHVMPGMQREAAEKMAGLIFRA